MVGDMEQLSQLEAAEDPDPKMVKEWNTINAHKRCTTKPSKLDYNWREMDATCASYHDVHRNGGDYRVLSNFEKKNNIERAAAKCDKDDNCEWRLPSKLAHFEKDWRRKWN